jgi:hypothetical protein
MHRGSRRVSGPHLGPAGVAPVELRVHQRRYVDPIDQKVLDLTVDADVDQLDAAHHYPAEVDPAELGVGEVDGAELGTCQVDTLETGAAQIIRREVSHGRTLAPAADKPPPSREHPPQG